MIDDILREEMIAEAHQLSQKIAAELLTPIAHWYAGKRTPELELVTTAYMTAILGCSVVLEQLFGEETLRPFLERAKKEASEFANATMH